MINAHPAATLIDAATLARIDDAISLHSDMYKDRHGFRPRLGVNWAHVAEDPAKFEGYVREKIAEMERADARKAEEREAFRAKVRALGLDPERYMALAD